MSSLLEEATLVPRPLQLPLDLAHAPHWLRSRFRTLAFVHAIRVLEESGKEQ